MLRNKANIIVHDKEEFLQNKQLNS